MDKKPDLSMNAKLIVLYQLDTAGKLDGMNMTTIGAMFCDEKRRQATVGGRAYRAYIEAVAELARNNVKEVEE